MRILITGANGQLGTELRQELMGETLILKDLPDFDLAGDGCEEQIADARPEVIVHAGAYTDVDGAEREPARAMAINAEGTSRVARAAAALGARLIYISTDYVFDGRQQVPYREDDRPNPLNMYGRSKLRGEEQVMKHCSGSLIVRTAWLYGASGRNFVKTIARLAAEQPVLRVVSDQRGCPTHAQDLAQAIGKLIRSDVKGILHATNSGDCTWYEFAQSIVEAMGLSTMVEPITTAEADRPARRPPYSVLSLSRLQSLGIVLPHWRESLTRFLNGSPASVSAKC